LAELKGAAGLQVHRSHYVMTAHMERFCREGGRLRLRLTDGRELPVSARYADKVRAALKQKAAA
jgi:DNA-binding LytR/AlgR family response regulator